MATYVPLSVGVWLSHFAMRMAPALHSVATQPYIKAGVHTVKVSQKHGCPWAAPVTSQVPSPAHQRFHWTLRDKQPLGEVSPRGGQEATIALGHTP